MNRREYIAMIRTAFHEWRKQDATLRAGAIAFFVIMSLPSLALLVIEILAQIYGQEQALLQFISQISTVTGPVVANLVFELLKDAQGQFAFDLGSFVSVSFTIVGAAGAFSALRKSVNAIWEIPPQKRTRGLGIKRNLAPFLLITIVGFIVTAWTAISTVFYGIMVLLLEPTLGSSAPLLLRVLHVVLSMILGTLLFAVIFKQLPEKEIEWRDVALVAATTSVVFTVLNYLFGIYLIAFPTATLAGTAGTLMLLFLWIYLMNLFLLFGAQFSRVFAETKGSLSKK